MGDISYFLTSQVELPAYRHLATAWKFLEYPDTSAPAKVFAILSVLVITASLVLFVMETLPEFSPHVVKNGKTRGSLV